METKEDHVTVKNSNKGLEQINSEKDESGFDEDISACSIEDKTVNIPVSSSTPMNKTFPVENSRKDDSGIFFGQSQNYVQKEMTDCDVSEIHSESTDDANSTTETKDGVIEMLKENNLCGDEGGTNNNLANKNSSNDVEVLTDVQMEVNGEVKDKASGQNNSESGKVSDSRCDTDSEEEDFSDFVKKTLKSRSHVRKLVEYENSDSSGVSDEDKNNCDASNAGKTKRNYRKRKTDNELNDSDTEARQPDADMDSVENGSGEPVLLRHSHLNESGTNNVVTISDLSSDSSEELDDDRKVEHDETDSEPEDTPMDISEFGPPKHKWRAMFDLRNRELGRSPVKGNGLFSQRVQGSLQMVQRLKLQYKMDHHEGCVNALNFNRAGTLLASGSDDLNVVIWNWIRNTPALVYDSGHRSNVFQTKFMPYSGDCHVVSCARDGQVRLADLSSTGVCKGTKKLAQHRGAAHKLALETDSPHLVLSAGEDAVTFEIDLRQDKPNKLVTTKEGDKKVSMYSIHSNPANSSEFCLGGRDHYIRVYDKRKINEEVNDGLLKKFSPHHITASENNNMKANVTCACYNYNGTEVLGSYNDEDIYLFDNHHSDEANYIHRYRGHRNNQTVKGVNFYGPESEFIVSGSDCGHIYLWDKDTENIAQYMQGDEGGVVNVLEPHPSIPVLATSGLDHDVKIWAPTAEMPTTLKGLRKATKQNEREREEERSSDAGMIDGSMLWFIMHHLRQGRRRRAREAREARGDPPVDDDTSDTLSDEDFTTDEDSEEEGSPRDAMSCNPS